MKILQNRQVRTFEEARLLAFQEAGKDDMSPDITNLFAAVMDIEKLQAEGEKSIKSVVRGRYGRNATWSDRQWIIPLPHLCFYTDPAPRLIITIQPCLVAPVKVETSHRVHSLILVGSVGKSEELVMPMTFLSALQDNDLGRFRVIAKNGNYTTWEVPGAKIVRFPHDFLARLSAILTRKSVVSWLEEFGPQGRSVTPLIVGCLLGLQFKDVVRALPAGKQTWTRETMINFLVETLGCRMTEAQEMFSRAAPDLRADQGWEEAIRTVLQQANKGARNEL